MIKGQVAAQSLRRSTSTGGSRSRGNTTRPTTTRRTARSGRSGRTTSTPYHVDVDRAVYQEEKTSDEVFE
jgi:hypothetical protein